VFSFRFGPAIIAALVLFNSAGAQADIVLESGGALVTGGLVGAAWAIAGAIVVGTLFPFPSPSGDPYDPSPLVPVLVGGTAGAALGYPCGCALGTAMVGSWMDCEGNTGLAYAGAYLGLPIGIGLAWLGVLAQKPGLAIPLCVAGGLAPPAGAVIGYNLHITKGRPPKHLGARLRPPALTFCTRSSPDRQTYYALDCRLVTVGF